MWTSSEEIAVSIRDGALKGMSIIIHSFIHLHTLLVSTGVVWVWCLCPAHMRHKAANTQVTSGSRVNLAQHNNRSKHVYRLGQKQHWPLKLLSMLVKAVIPQITGWCITEQWVTQFHMFLRTEDASSGVRIIGKSRYCGVQAGGNDIKRSIWEHRSHVASILMVVGSTRKLESQIPIIRVAGFPFLFFTGLPYGGWQRTVFFFIFKRGLRGLDSDL